MPALGTITTNKLLWNTQVYAAMHTLDAVRLYCGTYGSMQLGQRLGTSRLGPCYEPFPWVVTYRPYRPEKRSSI